MFSTFSDEANGQIQTGSKWAECLMFFDEFFDVFFCTGKIWCRWDDLILWRRLLSSAAERILVGWSRVTLAPLGSQGHWDMGGHGCVWKCCVPRKTQWFCWSLSRFEMAISLGIYPIFRQTHIVETWNATVTLCFIMNHPSVRSAHLCTDAMLIVGCQRCTLLRLCESQTNAFQPSFIRWAWDRHWQT